ncbi:dihydrodipicolinate synthase family protein [Sorangium sp. So ce118]
MVDYKPQQAKEWAKSQVRGIYVTLSTPERWDSEKQQFEIDEAGLRADVDRYINVNKVSGFFLFGMYGNFPSFTVEERMRGTEIIVNQNRGRVPIVCNCEHATLKDTMRLIEHASSVGCDMISLTGPEYAGNAASVAPFVEEYFAYIAARTPLGLCIDNINYVGYLMSPELMAKLGKHPAVGILKNVAPVAQTIVLRSLVGEEMVVIDPTEENHLVNILQFGQQATMDGNSMMYDSEAGTPMRDYFEAALAGDAKRSAELYYGMQPLRDVYEKWIRHPWDAQGRLPIVRFKYWSQLLGLTGGPTRPPVIDMTEAERAALRADLVAVGQIPASS